MKTAITRCTISLVGLIVLGGMHARVRAAEAPSSLPLSLEDCIQRALEHNLGIAAESISLGIAEKKVLEALAASHPRLGLAVSANRDRKPTASVLEGGEHRSELVEEYFIWDTSLSQPLPIGGSLALHFGNNRFETDSEYQTINPVYRSSLSLVWTQPLLNGFGPAVSTADAVIAQYDKEAAGSLFQTYVAGIIAETCSRYWNLIYAQADLEAKETALAQARQIAEMTEADMDEGRRPITDVLKARAEVSTRVGEVVAAQEAVKEAEDQLKLVTSLVEDPAVWDKGVVPTTELSCPDESIDESDCLRDARANRPEYRAARSQYDAAKLRVKLARNALLPTLDMVGQISLNGLGERYGDNVSQLRTRDFNAWGIGLTTSIPLGNRAARSVLHQRSLEERRMCARMESLEYRITAEVRQATRQIHTRLEQIDAAEQVKRFREKDLDATQERFRLGMATSEKALEAQRELAEARSNHVRALVAYNNALIHLQEVRGTLLRKYPLPSK
jgi:outer membrane protein TolC